MTASTAADIREFIDDGELRGPFLLVPVICVLLMFIEGIDAFGLGFISPFLSAEMALSAKQMGSIFTGSVFASLIGATLIAPLSDRLGRRVVLLGSSLLMIPTTIMTAHAPNFAVLFALRFLIGIAFGAALPAAIALVADYAPQRRKSLLLMILNAGIGGGVVIAGYGAAVLIPAFGWRSLLYTSAAISLVSAIFAWVWLPESLQHLVRRGRLREARSILQRSVKRPVPDELVCLDVGQSARQGIRDLFAAGTLATTLLLWLMISFVYVTVNFVAYWLPTVILDSGADIAVAGVTISTGKLCGIFGILVIGWLADRFGFVRVATTNFVATGLLIAAIAISPSGAVAIVLLVMALTIDGANMSCGQALIAMSYPSQLRATAFGWVSGFARLVGGGLGTMAGAWIVEGNWSYQQIGLLMALTFATNAVIIQVLQRAQRHGQT